MSTPDERAARLFIVQQVRAALQNPWHGLSDGAWIEASNIVETMYLILEREYQQEAKNDQS